MVEIIESILSTIDSINNKRSLYTNLKSAVLINNITGNLIFSDDIDLIAGSNKELQVLTNRLAEYSWYADKS